jgi:uncharacterized protein
MVRPVHVWVVTDGKAGDEQPCLGICDALEVKPRRIHLKPRAPFSWLMPWGPMDPRESPLIHNSPLAPPFPDLLIASGRRAIPALRAVKRASKGKVFTFFMKDPRIALLEADLIWVPEHDSLCGPHVVCSLTTPHRLTQKKIIAARANPDPRLSTLMQPRIAVLVGGNSRHHRFTPQNCADFLNKLRALCARGARSAKGASLMITASRRTPPDLTQNLRDLAAQTGGFFWDGSGENPYLSMLALADQIVVTADSFNMVGEAASTGAPISLFEPEGGHRKITHFLEMLRAQGVIRPLTGEIEHCSYTPLDSTPRIAQILLERYETFRSMQS